MGEDMARVSGVAGGRWNSLLPNGFLGISSDMGDDMARVSVVVGEDGASFTK